MKIEEAKEQAEHAQHSNNKRAALLIVALAAALAIIEMSGKEAMFGSIAHNIESADLYAFYQAKTIRSSVARVAGETVELLPRDGAAAPSAEARAKQIDSWKKEIARLDSDPESREGRKELLERAKQVGDKRDEELHAYHDFEFAAAALQLAIVMASAAVITEISWLEIISAGLGAVGILLGAIGWMAPALLRL